MPGEEAAASFQPGPRIAVARNALHLVLGQITTTVLAILLSAALGRSLGAADFGLYFLISASSTFAYVLVDWGQQFYVVRELARAPERAGQLLGSTLVLRIAGAALVAVPATLVSWSLGYGPRTSSFLVAFIAASLPFALSQGYGMIFRARDRMGLLASVTVINKAITLVAVLAALALGAGLSGVIGAQLVGGLAALVTAALLYRGLDAGTPQFSRAAMVEVLKGGSAIASMMVAVSVQPYLDALILTRLVPAAAVGWYGAARNIMGTLLAPSLIIGAAAYPTLSRASADRHVFDREVGAALRPMLILGALGAAGTYVFADRAISLVYGPRDFVPAGTILAVFAPALLLLFADVLFANALTALGRSTAFSIAKVGAVVVAIALELLLVPFFQRRWGNGGIGVVVASLASEVVVFAATARLMPEGTFGSAAAMMARAIASATATALIFHWLPPMPLYAGIPSCIVFFALCALATGLVRRSDVDLLAALIHGATKVPASPRTP
jgi:O-antigen/teichoic acid export membrane protein